MSLAMGIGFIQGHPLISAAAGRLPGADASRFTTSTCKRAVSRRRAAAFVTRASIAGEEADGAGLVEQTEQEASEELNGGNIDLSDLGDDDGDGAGGGVHDSWSIYSKPGNKCVVCLGRGYTKCLYCFGKGTVRIGPEEERDTVECPQCGGTGREICMRCDGTGIRPSYQYVLNEETMEVEKVANPTNEEICNSPSQAELESLERQRAGAEKK